MLLVWRQRKPTTKKKRVKILRFERPEGVKTSKFIGDLSIRERSRAFKKDTLVLDSQEMRSERRQPARRQRKSAAGKRKV
jgi:hypothetical protein